MKQIILEILRKRKIYFLSTLLLMISSIVFYVVTARQQLLIKDKKATIKSIKTKLASEKVRSDDNKLRKDLQALLKTIPPRKKFASILENLQEIVSLSKVNSSSIHYKPYSIKSHNLLTYQIEMRVSGSYLEIKDFIYNLQSSKYPIVLDAIKFSNKNPYRENVGMETQLTVYLRDGV